MTREKIAAALIAAIDGFRSLRGSFAPIPRSGIHRGFESLEEEEEEEEEEEDSDLTRLGRAERVPK